MALSGGEGTGPLLPELRKWKATRKPGHGSQPCGNWSRMSEESWDRFSEEEETHCLPVRAERKPGSPGQEWVVKWGRSGR